MLDFFKKCVWKNFAASIDMLSNAVAAMPAENWNDNKRFFYIAYHTTVFLDYYLTIPLSKFSALLSYTLTEFNKLPQDAVDDVVPDKIYSKQQLLDYIFYCRKKCKTIIAGLTQEKLYEQWINKSSGPNLDLASSVSLNYTVMEILFYNLRHVQHHAAQLNLLLRQTFKTAPDYVSEASDNL